MHNNNNATYSKKRKSIFTIRGCIPLNWIIILDCLRKLTLYRPHFFFKDRDTTVLIWISNSDNAQKLLLNDLLLIGENLQAKFFKMMGSPLTVSWVIVMAGCAFCSWLMYNNTLPSLTLAPDSTSMESASTKLKALLSALPQK
jgi:hypothetical protein